MIEFFSATNTAIVLWALLIPVILFVWFLLNRMSVRANEHIHLLHEIISQQQQQITLLQQIVEDKAPKSAAVEDDEETAITPEMIESLPLKGFIAER